MTFWASGMVTGGDLAAGALGVGDVDDARVGLAQLDLAQQRR